MKKTGYILSVVISTIIMGVIFWYLFKYFNRYTHMRARKQLTQQLDQDMKALQALGFASDSELLMTLRRYKGERVQGNQEQNKTIDAVCALQKKLLMSFVAEAKSLKRQGVDLKSNEMRFAYDTIVRLTVGVAELERQAKLSEYDVSGYERRLERMREITRASVAHYKRKLQDLISRHQEHDVVAQHARELLSARIRQYYELS